MLTDCRNGRYLPKWPAAVAVRSVCSVFRLRFVANELDFYFGL